MFQPTRVIARALLAPATVVAVALTTQPAASAAAVPTSRSRTPGRGAVAAGTPARLRGHAVSSSAGTGWLIQPTPNPTGTTISQLDAVSCSSAAACTAVGDYVSSSGGQVTLAERWNGTTGKWAIQLPPNTAAYGNSQLTAVSCPSPATCIAVGSTDNGVRTLAEQWNAATGKWTILPSGTGGEGSLQGVSCSSPTACTAVGWPGFNGALAERWNGVVWSAQQMSSPLNSGLNGVSCPTSTDCTAVGNAADGGGTFAEQWTGPPTRGRSRPP
jgi:hypothetical protein